MADATRSRCNSQGRLAAEPEVESEYTNGCALRGTGVVSLGGNRGFGSSSGVPLLAFHGPEETVAHTPGSEWKNGRGSSPGEPTSMPSPAGEVDHSVPILLDRNEPVSSPPLGPNAKVLMVWPRFPPSFWGFEGMLAMLPAAAISPPLGLITVAALCPPAWTIRLIDHAFDELRDEDLRWADLVMVSAMDAQRADAIAILARARSLGRRTFIGGPWASGQTCRGAPSPVSICSD